MHQKLPVTAALWAMAPVVSAQGNQLEVNTLGQTYNFWQIIGNIMEYLTGAIGAVAITMFVVGALFVTLSGIKEDWRQKGKDLMIGSAMSLAVVLGAYAILRMLEYFLTT
jgi:hypothetical protein